MNTTMSGTFREEESAIENTILCEFIERMDSRKEDLPDEEESAGETFLVGRLEDLDQTCNVTVDDDADPMYAHLATLQAHAVNKIAARIRRKHGNLHQGSFSKVGEESAFELTKSEVATMYEDGTLLYTSDEDECNSSDVENQCNTSTYVNIENFSSGETVFNGTRKNLPKITMDQNGDYVNLGRTFRSRKNRQNSPLVIIQEDEDELAENFEQLHVDKRRSSTFLTPEPIKRMTRSAPQSPQEYLREYELQNPSFTLTPSQRRKKGMRSTSTHRSLQDRERAKSMIDATLTSVLQSPNVKRRQKQRRALGMLD